jgi:glycerophosphocholine phosphodiesterase GPCPD1
LEKAAEHGADFVEFDVQLSKDFVPVLFHDFHVNIGLQQKAKKGGEMTTLRIPVKDLTLKQLHELKVLFSLNLCKVKNDSREIIIILKKIFSIFIFSLLKKYS